MYDPMISLRKAGETGATVLIVTSIIFLIRNNTSFVLWSEEMDFEITIAIIAAISSLVRGALNWKKNHV